MRIGELAEKSGVSRDTIRFYERNGLITSRTGESETNNYRDYAEDNVLWLEFVTGAREAGMSIADLRDIVRAMDGRCAKETAQRVIGDKLAELEARRAEIQSAMGFLEQALVRVSKA